MDIRHRFIYNMSQRHAQILKKELDKLGLSYEIHDDGEVLGKPLRFIEFTISEKDTLFPIFEKLIRKHKFKVQTGVYYDESDLDNAEWLYVAAGGYQYPQPEDLFLEETYDISKLCARCGFGMEQINPFRLKSDFIQKDVDFLGLHWVEDELFARPRTKLLLEKEDVSGISFIHPLQHKTNQPIENVYQIKINTITEPGLYIEGLDALVCIPSKKRKRKTKARYKAFGVTGYRDDLPYCGNTNYYYPRRGMIKFHRKTFDDKPDIVKSNELFGEGIGHHLILVSKRFFLIVKKHDLTGLNFAPIELI